MDLIRIILSVILPPVGVFLQVGLGKHFWLNILLTLLGYIPGIVHAVWIIARTPEHLIAHPAQPS
ncbi:MAG: YqaE/Pmp3 family membrane protein [Pseudomonadota bacterium]